MTTETRRRALDALRAAAADAQRRLGNVYTLAKDAEAEGAAPGAIRAAMLTEGGGVLRALNDPAEGPVVSLADVTAALVACYPSTVGNATDIGVRLGVRGVAEWLGVDLDAARAADGQEG